MMISAATEPSREPEKVLPNRLPFFAKAQKIRAAASAIRALMTSVPGA